MLKGNRHGQLETNTLTTELQIVTGDGIYFFSVTKTKSHTFWLLPFVIYGLDSAREIHMPLRKLDIFIHNGWKFTTVQLSNGSQSSYRNQPCLSLHVPSVQVMLLSARICNSVVRVLVLCTNSRGFNPLWISVHLRMTFSSHHPQFHKGGRCNKALWIEKTNANNFLILQVSLSTF